MWEFLYTLWQNLEKWKDELESLSLAFVSKRVRIERGGEIGPSEVMRIITRGWRGHTRAILPSVQLLTCHGQFPPRHICLPCQLQPLPPALARRRPATKIRRDGGGVRGEGRGGEREKRAKRIPARRITRHGQWSRLDTQRERDDSSAWLIIGGSRADELESLDGITLDNFSRENWLSRQQVRSVSMREGYLDFSFDFRVQNIDFRLFRRAGTRSRFRFILF